MQANEFEGIHLCREGDHFDPLQLNGASNVTIDGNYFHDNDSGIMDSDGAGSPMTVTNNVMVSTGYSDAIVDDSGDGDLIRHNTFVGWSVGIGIANGAGEPDDITIKDNVMSQDIGYNPDTTYRAVTPTTTWSPAAVQGRIPSTAPRRSSVGPGRVPTS